MQRCSSEARKVSLLQGFDMITIDMELIGRKSHVGNTGCGFKYLD
jgi:hypothetical protein